MEKIIAFPSQSAALNPVQATAPIETQIAMPPAPEAFYIRLEGPCAGKFRHLMEESGKSANTLIEELLTH